MIHDTLEKEGGSPAHTVTPSHFTTDHTLSFELREHLRRLRLILPVVIVSVMALRRQNAEQDDEIASVLSEHACARLDDEIECLSLLLAAYTSRSRQVGVRV